AFVNRHPNCGAIGVKMIDGAGYFLPESKRAFPTPVAALFKLCRLADIFPKSAVFNQYALGHLSENEIHCVPVLSGACMFVSHQVLDTTGGFDEQFFMYGEDIDLSYRIELAGFQNYYNGKVTILHFKGESKPPDYLEHVQQFYGAMQVFVKKHYKGSRAFLMAILLQTAIMVSAFFSFITKPLRANTIVFFDFTLLILANIFALFFWKYVFHNGIPFNTFFVPYALVLYALVFTSILWMGGVYDSRYKPSQTISSGILAILVLLALYALLPEQIRFSRGVVVLSGVLGLLGILLFRKLLQPFKWLMGNNANNLSAIAIGSPETLPALQQFLQYSEHYASNLSIITTAEITDADAHIWNHLPASTIIFGWGKGLSIAYIIEKIQTIPGQYFYRFFNNKTNHIIGSDGRSEKGAVLSSEIKYNIALPAQRRMKRCLDILFAIGFYCCGVFILLAGAKGTQLLYQAWQVLTGKKTWIGYTGNHHQIPPLKPCVINTLGSNSNQSLTLPPTLIQKTDEVYALQYEWPNDIIFMFQHLNALFKNP
ncbi:glycosyltransferase family 2 protein, partial [Hydrotalea sp.]